MNIVENKWANILRILGVSVWIILFIGGLVVGTEKSYYSSEINSTIVMYFTTVGFLNFVFMFSFAEIITILHDIRNKANEIYPSKIETEEKY